MFKNNQNCIVVMLKTLIFQVADKKIQNAMTNSVIIGGRKFKIYKITESTIEFVFNFNNIKSQTLTFHWFFFKFLKVTCNNFANCVNNTNTCICQPGYTGPTCSVQLSCDKMCRNNGTCDFQGIEEVCICSEGFTGSECQYSLNICNQS